MSTTSATPLSTTSDTPLSTASPPVKVTFKKDGDPQFTFARKTVRMKARGVVVLTQDDPQAEWRFKSAEVKDDTLHEFSSFVPGDGRVLHIKDEFLDKDFEAYSYNITVELDGTDYTSPDPVIVNDPGGGGLSAFPATEQKTSRDD